MDRYVVREPRMYSENQDPGQNMQYSHAAGSQEQLYNLYRNENIVNVPYTNVNPQLTTTYQNRQYIEHGFMPVGVNLGPSMSGSGIDSNYFSRFSNNSTYLAATGGNKMAQTNVNPAVPVIHTEYQNRNLIGPERAKQEIIMARRRPPSVVPNNLLKSQASINAVMNEFNPISHQTNIKNKNFKNVSRTETRTTNLPRDVNEKQSFEIETQKTEEKKVPTKADKTRSLQKSGPRAFCGSVEKVLKWHKALQEIGITIFFEIVAKCVSVRTGESCSKILVVRDENGPAMQVVYYEIDFLLPTLKPPCTVRVVGKMMLGTCRLQAYNVRSATGDDMAILPRRAAVAEHHVIKLSKEFGNNP